MKKSVCIIIILFLFILLNVHIAAENLIEIDMLVGEVYTICLEENTSTGYRWDYEIDHTDIIDMVDAGIDYEDDTKGKAGYGNFHFWRFAGLHEGTVEIVFTLKRNWGNFKSLETKKYKINVKAKSFTNCDQCKVLIDKAYENKDIDVIKKIVYNIYLSYNPKNIPVKYRCNEHKLYPAVIESIKRYPEDYLDEIIVIDGYFMGWGGGYGPPPVTRSDWILAENNEYIYVVGRFPNGLHPMQEEDIGVKIRVKGVLRKVEYEDIINYYIDTRSLEE